MKHFFYSDTSNRFSNCITKKVKYKDFHKLKKSSCDQLTRVLHSPSCRLNPAN